MKNINLSYATTSTKFIVPYFEHSLTSAVIGIEYPTTSAVFGIESPRSAVFGIESPRSAVFDIESPLAVICIEVSLSVKMTMYYSENTLSLKYNNVLIA